MDNITIIFKGGNAYACRGTVLLLTFYLEILDRGSLINKFDIDFIDAVYVNGVLIYLKGKRFKEDG